MSQKMPKLPQLNPTVHGTGYLEENYGKNNFGFSEIPPKMRISDIFVMYFGFFTSDFHFGFICEVSRMVFRIFIHCNIA